jgi:hypothetical protein
MSEINPRQSIPPEWGEKARCPVCSATGLCVARQVNSADQLQCRACGLSFEVEQDGNRLRITHWPTSRPGLTGWVWLTVGELQALVNQAVPAPVPVQPAGALQKQAPPAAMNNGATVRTQNGSESTTRPAAAAQQTGRPLPEAPELVARIRKLRSLGNSYPQIRAVLTETIPDPAQRKAALQIAASVERQDQGQQQNKLWTLFGIVAILGLVLVGVVIFLQKNSAVQSSVVAPVQATLGSDIVQTLRLATPVVHQYAADSNLHLAVCPKRPRDAASLFGGRMEDWRSSNGGWIMLNPTKSVTLNIPYGMTAAYMVVSDHFTLAEVQGPATMENVYYIAVSCPIY